MRAAEWLNLGYFSFFLVFAWVRPLGAERRLRVGLIGAAGLGLTLAAVVSPDYFSPRWSILLRDWLPVPLMLMAYWQAGQFFERPSPRLQTLLEDLDRRWLGSFAENPPRGWLGAYLEFAYLFCYPVVPLALGTLYFGGLGTFADEFWRVVLPASYACYAMVPFFQTLPPRVREESRAFGAAGQPRGPLGVLNLFILERASIHANTFPSAHVAASVGAALAVLRHLPWAGAVFLWIAASIAAAAVLRRYHFALDVLAGALVAAIAFFLAV
jgi:membrane-associated phospholipid phosphatase